MAVSLRHPNRSVDVIVAYLAQYVDEAIDDVILDEAENVLAARGETPLFATDASLDREMVVGAWLTVRALRALADSIEREGL